MLHIFQKYTFIITIMAWFLFKKLKDISQNDQNRRSGETENHIYKTYKNTVMPYGRHIYAKAYDMAKATICAYSQSYHALPHWKRVLRCCAKCTRINLPDQETYYQCPNTSPSIIFHVCRLIECCTKHGRLLLTDNKRSRLSTNSLMWIITTCAYNPFSKAIFFNLLWLHLVCFEVNFDFFTMV